MQIIRSLNGYENGFEMQNAFGEDSVGIARLSWAMRRSTENEEVAVIRSNEVWKWNEKQKREMKKSKTKKKEKSKKKRLCENVKLESVLLRGREWHTYFLVFSGIYVSLIFTDILPFVLIVIM